MTNLLRSYVNLWFGAPCSKSLLHLDKSRAPKHCNIGDMMLSICHVICRGVAREFLEVGSNSSKMPATLVNRGIKFWVAGTAKTVNFGPYLTKFHVL